MRSAVWTILCALLVLLSAAPARAQADAFVVKDGDAFAIDLFAPSACFVLPTALRERAPCEGLEPPKSDAVEPKGHVLGMGLVTLADGRTKVAVTLGRTESSSGMPDSQEQIEKYGSEVQRGIQDSLGSAGVARTVESKLVHVGELPVIRVTTQVDGLAADDPRAHMLEYLSSTTFFSREATYSLSVGGLGRDSAAIEKLVSEISKTATVKTAAPPARHDEESPAYQLGRFTAYGLMASALVLALLWDRRRRRRWRLVAEAAPMAPRKKKRKKRSPAGSTPAGR